MSDPTDEIVLDGISYSRERGLRLLAKHPSFVTLAVEIAKFFKAEGGTNYVELEMFNEETGPLVLTVQRKLGKSLGQVVAELRRVLANIQQMAATELDEEPPDNSLLWQIEADARAALAATEIDD